MASLAEALRDERARILQPDRAWYQPVATTAPFGQLVRSQAAPWATPFSVEVVQASIRRKTGKKRPKDYSSDSSASERETDKHTEGRIYRAPKGSGKDYYVYYKGKKISFGDSSMPNRQNNDGARKNFQARHNCAEKKDKSKAGYWACRVWRKGYKGPSSGGDKKKKKG